MSRIRQKSDFNIDAAEKLLTLSLFAPSVHCSYYSCFQLMKYALKSFWGLDYSTQAANIVSTGKGTHQYVIDFMSKELKVLAGKEESRKFKRTIKDLRQFRLESDYDNVEIDSDMGSKAFIKAQEIRDYLIKNCQV